MRCHVTTSSVRPGALTGKGSKTSLTKPQDTGLNRCMRWKLQDMDFGENRKQFLDFFFFCHAWFKVVRPNFLVIVPRADQDAHRNHRSSLHWANRCRCATWKHHRHATDPNRSQPPGREDNKLPGILQGFRSGSETSPLASCQGILK
jgi:hypothetical protein